MLILGSVVAIMMSWRLRKNRGLLIVVGAALAAIVAHLFLGTYGWFHRYEAYSVALMVLVILSVAAALKRDGTLFRWREIKLFVSGFVLAMSIPFMNAAVRTPIASRGIYEQQYQMALFAKEIWKRPVAVNDLGLVSYRNPNFVLDLFGLGSEKVRIAKSTGQFGPDLMSALAAEYKVGIVMIYDDWYPQGIPATWKKVAVLHTIKETSAFAEVAFYRTALAASDDVAAALASFKKRLPSGTSLDIQG